MTSPPHDTPSSFTIADPHQSAIGGFAFVMLITFMGVITARLVDSESLRSANDRSRWCTVYSLVEENTYQIDTIRQKSGWDTIDLVRHNDHFYSTKPPLLPRLVAEVYRLVKWSTGLNLLNDTATVTRIIIFLINIIPTAIALWMMYGVIRRHCTELFSQVFLITATTWATLLVPFTIVLNNHTVGATFIIYSLVLAISILAEDKTTWWRFALCGFCAAFAVCNELPAAAYGLALFFMLARKDLKLTLLCFVPAALIPLAGFFITNYHATGGWKPFYMYYGTEKYRFVFEGKPSYWMNPQGIDQARESPLIYFMHCTIGHHGIFSLTPIYLITFFSWLTPFFWWKSRLRAFHLLGLALSVIVLGFYMTKTDNYNYGGVSVALRWMLWLTPFWILTMIPLLNRSGSSLFLRLPILAFLLVSLFSAWSPTNAPWTHPWLFSLMEKYKWINYEVPRPKFDRTHYSWIGTLPTGEKNDDYWITFSAFNPDGSLNSIRLTDAGPTADGRRRVSVERNGEAIDYIFDPAKLNAGQRPDDYITHSDGSELSADELKFFYGVPERRAYASSRIRYIDTSLRRNALRAHIGYTYIDQTVENDRKLRFQRDVWFSEEIPFGVFQWEDRVTDPKTKETLIATYWKATSTGLFLPRMSEP